MGNRGNCGKLLAKDQLNKQEQSDPVPYTSPLNVATEGTAVDGVFIIIHSYRLEFAKAITLIT